MVTVKAKDVRLNDVVSLGADSVLAHVVEIDEFDEVGDGIRKLHYKFFGTNSSHREWTFVPVDMDLELVCHVKQESWYVVQVMNGDDDGLWYKHREFYGDLPGALVKLAEARKDWPEFSFRIMEKTQVTIEKILEA